MHWLLAIAAALCLGLNVYNVFTAGELRTLRGELQQRQTYLNQGLQYRQVNNQLINALANIAASENDEAIRDLLASEGVTFTLKQDDAGVDAAADVATDDMGSDNE